MPNGSACRLTPTPLDPVCNFRASSPGEVTLEVKSTVGSVAIDSASKYSGGAITFLSASQIKFTVVSGHTFLTLVYVFSDGVNGAGTLNEVCTANTFLSSLNASTPAELYTLCA